MFLPNETKTYTYTKLEYKCQKYFIHYRSNPDVLQWITGPTSSVYLSNVVLLSNKTELLVHTTNRWMLRVF